MILSCLSKPVSAIHSFAFCNTFNMTKCKKTYLLGNWIKKCSVMQSWKSTVKMMTSHEWVKSVKGNLIIFLFTLTKNVPFSITIFFIVCNKEQNYNERLPYIWCCATYNVVCRRKIHKKGQKCYVVVFAQILQLI